MRVTVPSFAKLNLDLRVLHKRPDGYHELRTVFQTVSLRDTLTIDYQSARRTEFVLESSVDIPDNLVLRAAKMALEALEVKARVGFSLKKRIPMGAGLGGGSSNAAAVLIAVSALARKRTKPEFWAPIAESLGSDVPFFLYGGTAVGLGRGAELYPLPDLPAHPAVIVHPGIHVSTAEAYRALDRPLTSTPDSLILREFQTVAWTLNDSSLAGLPLKNDFEEAVFDKHPQLPSLMRKLRRMGGKPVRMTGSGSAVFGVFGTQAEAQAAAAGFPAGSAVPVRFIRRGEYRQTWRRALREAARTSCFA